MNLSPWKSLVWSVVAILSVWAGLPSQLDACCFSWLCGSFCGGGYGTGYSGYYGGYAPYYGSYGGCDTCGPTYAPSYSSMGGYASTGISCVPCSGSGCGVTIPAGNPTRPTPDDGFRKLPGGASPDDKPSDRLPRTRRKTFEDDELNGGTSGNPARPAPGARPDGSDTSRGRKRIETETLPETDATDFKRPFGPKTGSGEDLLDGNANKLPMPDDPERKVPVPDDAFPTDDADEAEETKVNRPNLGTPVKADETSTDDANGEIIRQKQPAPVDETPEDSDQDDTTTERSLPVELSRDDVSTTTGIAPKTRQSLSGRFGTPAIARLKLRPNREWLAAPQAPVLAKH